MGSEPHPPDCSGCKVSRLRHGATTPLTNSSGGLSRSPSWPRPLTFTGFVVEEFSAGRSEKLRSVMTLSVS